MARKKEPDLEIKNKDRIAQIAKQLFLQNGIENTTMSDLAKAVNMSKSTLYVYFKSKQDVKNYLSLEAMTYFYEQLQANIYESQTAKDSFLAICHVLVDFQKNYPLNFEILIQEICVEQDVLARDEVLRKTYETGEAVNQFLFQTIGQHVIAENNIDLFLQIFSMWGKLYGIITLANNKEQYILLASGMTKNEFLNFNFYKLYDSLPWKNC